MKTKIIGIDPGLNCTGWGIIEMWGSNLGYIASGVIKTKSTNYLSSRLASIFVTLNDILEEFAPNAAAIEETYVNSNFGSSLKLAHARAAAMLSLETKGLPPIAYQAKQVKKAVVGYGGADKLQMIRMINLLLPTAKLQKADAADAIAIAICHSSYHNFKAL
ncbi:crossover junction endodeoxyribonuclease RuvC [Holosporaceae bacterium 'Namur']|nr:crossover junction endodeoxyribonuclease RuvC [Holosporaceae bacterium 'Namur']